MARKQVPKTAEKRPAESRALVEIETTKFSPMVLESEKIASATGAIYKYSRMVDVSGKNQIYENIDFSYSVITRGYFHQASFKKCNFVGTRFIDCNFRNANFSDCKFDYSDFTGVRIENDEIIKNLPERPNVRRELLQILRKNALTMGDVASGRTFVLAELAARKEHLRRAWKQDEAYYKRKYGGFRNSTSVLFKRVGLWLDDFLWGHGEKLWRLALSTGTVLVFVSIISAVAKVDDFKNLDALQFGSDFIAYLTDYFSLFLDSPYKSTLPHYFYLDWLIVIFRYLSLGVFVSGLFRWLSHR